MEEFQAVLAEPLEASYRVTKINRKNKRQTRVLAITVKALYNCQGATVKRRISLSLVTGVVLNGSSADEFIVQIPSEYGYRFLSPDRDVIVAKLRWLKTRNALQPNTFTTWTALGGNFASYCVPRFSGSAPPEPQRADVAKSPQFFNEPVLPVPENSLLLGQSARREVRLIKQDPRTSFAQTCYRIEEPVSRDIFHKVDDAALVLINNVTIEGSHIIVYSEYCDLGDLGFLLALHPGGLSPSLINYIAGQIGMGLKALHQNGQVFRELRPSKVLFTAQADVKLNYSGLDTNQLQLPNRYPEYLLSEDYNFEADWWALAVLVYEMLHGSVPDSALLGQTGQAKAEVFTLLHEKLSLNSIGELADCFTVSPDHTNEARHELKNCMKQSPVRNRAIRRG